MWKRARSRHAHGGDRGKDQAGACSERSTIRSTSCTSSLPPRRALNCTSEDIVWGKARDEVRVYLILLLTSRSVNFGGLPAIHESVTPTGVREVYYSTVLRQCPMPVQVVLYSRRLAHIRVRVVGTEEEGKRPGPRARARGHAHGFSAPSRCVRCSVD